MMEKEFKFTLKMENWNYTAEAWKNKIKSIRISLTI